MLSFRLSRREYDLAQEASRFQGYRSIALFARSAVLDRTAKSRDPSTVEIIEIQQKVAEMSSELRILTQNVGLLSRSLEIARQSLAEDRKQEEDVTTQ